MGAAIQDSDKRERSDVLHSSSKSKNKEKIKTKIKINGKEK